ncbi:MAG TPA: GNAT family N-acetyltransferase [Candidatus Nanopelagicaceae bacterium]|jgi:GNAT superfamily N-acetyltransferase
MDVRALPASELELLVSSLARILCECVADGASVSFMSDLSQDVAEEYWHGISQKSAAGDLIVFGAFIADELVGTATLITATPPNQPHRADVAKVLVRPAFQRRGIAKALMITLEKKALEIGKDLLVLDTLTGSGAEALYAGLGWKRVGEIPRYALTPDGQARATMVFYKELSRG